MVLVLKSEGTNASVIIDDEDGVPMVEIEACYSYAVTDLDGLGHYSGHFAEVIKELEKLQDGERLVAILYSGEQLEHTQASCDAETAAHPLEAPSKRRC